MSDILSFQKPSEPLTVSQAFALYEKLGDKTTEPNRSECRRLRNLFVTHVQDCPVSECLRRYLALFLAANPQWSANWTIGRITRTIQRPFNWLVENDYIDRNPFRGVPVESGERGRPMLSEERQKLLRASTPCFRRVLIFMQFTGARPCEVRRLEWSFLNLERSCAVFHRHKTARTRRDQKARILMLHPCTVKMLLWIRRRQPESKFVFLNSRGKPWTRTALDLRLYRLRDRLGIPKDCKLYGARHEFATRAAMKDVDLATLAELLGHTTTRMSEYYVHIAGQKRHLEDAIRKMFEK